MKKRLYFVQKCPFEVFVSFSLPETANKYSFFFALGIDLWSNNVPIIDGMASFVARGNKPKKFNFNLGTELMPTDKLHVDFYTVTAKKNRKKIIAVFDLILETLSTTKYIDLKEENLSAPNNNLLKATVQLKLYYTPPGIDKINEVLTTAGDEFGLVDWGATFDDGGRHGGHRTRHVRSKNDSTL